MTRWLPVLVFTVATASAAEEKRVSFRLPSGVSIEIVEESFRQSEHRIVGCDDQQPACLIDGRIPFGSAFLVPKSYVRSISATFDGVRHNLDVSQMYDAWGDRPLSYGSTIRYFGGQCSDSQNCSFRGLFSDAGGSFVAEWVVIDGVGMRTVLTSSSDVMNLFIGEIDPPTFVD